MKYHITVNTGSSMAKVDSVEIPQDVLDWASANGYTSWVFDSGQSALFIAPRLAESLSRLLDDLESIGDVDEALHVARHLARLLAKVDFHHGAMVEFSRT